VTVEALYILKASGSDGTSL